MKEFNSLDIRPYQLMCCVCRLGAQSDDAYYFSDRLDEILGSVRANPNLPLTLRCSVSTVFSYQNPGRHYDTPEGNLFNDKRDLDILQKLALVPGETRPALELVNRLFETLPACKGICGYDAGTSGNWKGCQLAKSGNYERGHFRGVSAMIPAREKTEMAVVKRESCEALYHADVLSIRPHHLMCMACFYGREKFEAVAADNLFEAIDIIQTNPDIPITLVQGPCMICPPCNHYDKRTNWCIGDVGIGLRDEKKDLDVLQLLGLAYGDTRPAKELFQRLFDRIPSTRLVCAYKDGIMRSRDWRICSEPEGALRYVKGRETLRFSSGAQPEAPEQETPGACKQ